MQRKEGEDEGHTTKGQKWASLAHQASQNCFYSKKNEKWDLSVLVWVPVSKLKYYVPLYSFKIASCFKGLKNCWKSSHFQIGLAWLRCKQRLLHCNLVLKENMSNMHVGLELTWAFVKILESCWWITHKLIYVLETKLKKTSTRFDFEKLKPSKICQVCPKTSLGKFERIEYLLYIKSGLRL